jgi:hypothetical protein
MCSKGRSSVRRPSRFRALIHTEKVMGGTFVFPQ